LSAASWPRRSATAFGDGGNVVELDQPEGFVVGVHQSHQEPLSQLPVLGELPEDVAVDHEAGASRAWIGGGYRRLGKSAGLIVGLLVIVIDVYQILF
jgi:hypothetical protein